VLRNISDALSFILTSASEYFGCTKLHLTSASEYFGCTKLHLTSASEYFGCTKLHLTSASEYFGCTKLRNMSDAHHRLSSFSKYVCNSKFLNTSHRKCVRLFSICNENYWFPSMERSFFLMHLMSSFISLRRSSISPSLR